MLSLRTLRHNSMRITAERNPGEYSTHSGKPWRSTTVAKILAGKGPTLQRDRVMLRDLTTAWLNKYAGLLFHGIVIALTGLLLVATAIGCMLVHLRVPQAADLFRQYAAILPLAVWLLVQFWRTGHRNSFEALLLYLELKVFEQTIGPSICLLAHLGRGAPLADTDLARIDAALRLTTPEIVAWCRHAHLFIVSLIVYVGLGPLLELAFLVPLFAGNVRVARIFMGANLLAFVLAFPIFFFFPAVGPWFVDHAPPLPAQASVQAGLLALRQPGPGTLTTPGIVCIPSFHVIWAIICAYSLWHCRFRVPAAVFSFLLIVSTLTTGWHYFVDVLAGALVGVVSIALARAFVMASDPALREAAAPAPAMPAAAESY
jgi:hypothetical protein